MTGAVRAKPEIFLPNDRLPELHTNRSVLGMVGHLHAKQLAIAEIEEMIGAVRIGTFRKHKRSSCAGAEGVTAFYSPANA
jgi:hypothetical protein